MGGDRTFEVALVLAGAVSGGAYTAGVVDFLIEALDEWELQRGHAELPDHRVALRVLCGTSAGAICAALAAHEIARATPSRRRRDGDPYYVRSLYEAWVVRPDIHALCREDDLRRDPTLKSLLDATVIDDIAREVIDDETRAIAPRAYAGDPCTVAVTCTNLRGVPYRIRFEGAITEHDALTHADYVEWPLPSAPGDGARAAPPNWPALFDAAKASSAFPVGLAARVLPRTCKEYGARAWEVMVEDGNAYRPVLRSVTPNWPPGIGNAFPCVNVDGAVFDNEPLEHARRLLSGAEHNPRNGELARRAVVMVNPFPEACPPIDGMDSDTSLLAALRATVGAVLRQQRFKPHEIALAQDETVYSRFLVAPRRSERPRASANDGAPPRARRAGDHDGDEDDDEGARPGGASSLATASVGHFGGFLARSFREHDFALGRRNCQRFLQKHFAVYAENPIVRAWPEAATRKKEFTFHEEDGDPRTKEGHDFRVLLPLVGSAAKPIAQRRWPRLDDAEWRAIRACVTRRADAVAARFARDEGFGVLGLGVRLGWQVAKRPLLHRALGAIDADLQARRLRRDERRAPS